MSQEQEDYIAGLQDTIDNALIKTAELIDEINDLKEANKGLRRKIALYGAHRPSCMALNPLVKCDCTCGLNE